MADKRGQRPIWTKETVAAHLLDNFHRDPIRGCWLWQGARGENGYGRVTIDGRTWEVHRIAYNAFKGPFDCWLSVCHTCDNRICINPDHLFTGSRRDNAQDMVRKGRQAIRILNQSGSKNHSAKLTNQDIEEIRSLAGSVTQREIAARFRICQPHVSDIINRRRWSRG